jgi:hypothetical protein
MKVRRMGSKSKVRLLRTRVLWVCLLTGLFVIAIAIRPGARTTFAQSTEPQAAPPPATSDAAAGATAQAPSQDQAAKAQVTDASTNPPKKQIALDGANLLKMANDLKANMDKTTPDTLSVAVIRQAEEIEKLAHKMRSK